MFTDFDTLLKSKRYSPNTIKTYVGLLQYFSDYIGEFQEIHRLDAKHLLQKIREIILDKSYAYTTQKQLLSALALYLKEMHNRETDFSTLRPKSPQKILPDILSLAEVKLILDKTKNTKHKAMLTTIYALGLRSGELIDLEIAHLDGSRNMIFIKQTK